jgi:hypothetical protein
MPTNSDDDDGGGGDDDDATAECGDGGGGDDNNGGGGGDGDIAQVPHHCWPHSRHALGSRLHQPAWPTRSELGRAIPRMTLRR